MEILERAFKSIPGLTLVFAIVALLMADKTSELAEVIRIFVIAWLLYRVSRELDRLFDVLYGIPKERKTRFWKKLSEDWHGARLKVVPAYARLEQKREAAKRKLRRQNMVGIYEESKRKALQLEKWESDVYGLLSASKAMRALIIPFLLIAVLVAGAQNSQSFKLHLAIAALMNWPVMRDFRENFGRAAENFHFISRWEYSLVLALLFSLLYVYLRIAHMFQLYDIVVNEENEQGKTAEV